MLVRFEYNDGIHQIEAATAQKASKKGRFHETWY